MKMRTILVTFILIMEVDATLSSSATSIEYDLKRTVGGTSQIPGTEAVPHNTLAMEGEA
jgi:hypothetical protein